MWLLPSYILCILGITSNVGSTPSEMARECGFLLEAATSLTMHVKPVLCSARAIGYSQSQTTAATTTTSKRTNKAFETNHLADPSPQFASLRLAVCCEVQSPWLLNLSPLYCPVIPCLSPPSKLPPQLAVDVPQRGPRNWCRACSLQNSVRCTQHSPSKHNPTHHNPTCRATCLPR